MNDMSVIKVLLVLLQQLMVAAMHVQNVWADNCDGIERSRRRRRPTCELSFPGDYWSFAASPPAVFDRSHTHARCPVWRWWWWHAGANVHCIIAFCLFKQTQRRITQVTMFLLVEYIATFIALPVNTSDQTTIYQIVTSAHRVYVWEGQETSGRPRAT